VFGVFIEISSLPSGPKAAREFIGGHG
jgi:hypothetical protein